MSKIKIMDELLANKIAAGEVVERCASVVKELVENSIDAGSKQIKVELIDAGTREIKVIDDGSGMDEEDAVLAFSRHATSKLKNESELFRISTLGFRGEALASIASVSKITLKTSTGGIGTLVNIEGGKVISVEKGDARKGTIITVKDLFYNTPARLKHMKSLYTELASITDYMNKLSLSHPDISFTLINNGNILLQTDGSGNLLKTISSIFGIEVVRNMIEIENQNEDYDIKGYITIPEINRANRNNIITLVNGRVVRNTDVNRVINDSYHTYKPDNRYPIVVLNITVDPSLIDVNIHPTKMDIKFSKLEELNNLIETTIRNSLQKLNLISKVEIKKETPPVSFQEQISFDTVEEPVVKYESSVLTIDKEHTKEIYVEEIIEEQPKEIVFEKKLEEIERMPIIYPVGLVHGTYIIGQNELGMYLIDQHAAEERINYEIIKEKLGKPGDDSIELLIPINIELSNHDFIILKENINILKHMNFDVEEFGLNSIIVKRHPTWLPKNREVQAIKNIIDLIVQKEHKFSIEKFNEKIAIMISCKMSIKANENISLEEMQVLINRLRDCYNPFNCPHGRPTIIHYSKYELEKLFKRTGF